MATFKSTTDTLSLQTVPTNPTFINLTGKRFGRLVVLGLYGKNIEASQPIYYWVCLCECGNQKPIQGVCLRRGTTTSCGCYGKEQAFKKNATHNETGSSAEYSSYSHAKNRCNNPKHHAFSEYGGRGIKFLFNSYEEFLAELGRKPTAQHSIDRIDVNGNYEKGNVRWASKSEQQCNRRNTRTLTVKGETHNLIKWARITGIKYSTITSRMSVGWCDECIVNPIIKKSRCNHKKVKACLPQLPHKL